MAKYIFAEPLTGEVVLEIPNKLALLTCSQREELEIEVLLTVFDFKAQFMPKALERAYQKALDDQGEFDADNNSVWYPSKHQYEQIESSESELEGYTFETMMPSKTVHALDHFVFKDFADDWYPENAFEEYLTNWAHNKGLIMKKGE